MSDELARIQSWYLSQCDGDWEHSYGIRIDTLDNPGWRVSIDIEDTPLVEAAFEAIAIERSDDDWVRCWVALSERPPGRAFQAACGPQNLSETFAIFLSWTQQPHG